MNLVMACALLRGDPAWAEAGKLLDDPSPERTVERRFLACHGRVREGAARGVLGGRGSRLPGHARRGAAARRSRSDDRGHGQAGRLRAAGFLPRRILAAGGGPGPPARPRDCSTAGWAVRPRRSGRPGRPIGLGRTWPDARPGRQSPDARTGPQGQRRHRLASPGEEVQQASWPSVPASGGEPPAGSARGSGAGPTRSRRGRSCPGCGGPRTGQLQWPPLPAAGAAPLGGRSAGPRRPGRAGRHGNGMGAGHGQPQHRRRGRPEPAGDAGRGRRRRRRGAISCSSPPTRISRS